MKLYDWKSMEPEQLTPLAARQMLHADRMTVARLILSKGAVVQRHSHENEQITILETGRLLFIFDDSEQIVEAGQVLQIPSHVPHRVEALEESVTLDVFAPIREDWMRGQDAYLR